MRITRILILALSLCLLSGCAAMQQNVNLDAQNITADVDVVETQQEDVLRLIKPANGFISSNYGVRRRSNNKPRIHAGIDIAAKRGSDVLAAAPGTVVFSGRKNGYGKTVKIDHGNDRRTLYAHMDKIFVSEGQTLAQGERLGLVGRTGRTTGPHLHFELHVNGNHTNPIPEEGWAELDLSIVTAAAPVEAIVPSADTAANETIAVKTEAPGELAVASASTLTNSILSFFRKKARPSDDSAQATKENLEQPAS